MSVKRRSLGRGLDSLLGTEPAPKVEKTKAVEPSLGFLELPIGKLRPNRFQPRSFFDQSGIEELAESIRIQGVVQPIVATPDGNGQYTIIAGERRWRASQRANLQTVPVVIREVSDDQQLLEMALVENLQRADLNPIEEAEAFRTLGESFSLSQEEIAKRVGKGRTTITNTLRLLRLPEEIQDLLREGRLTAGQARPLLAIPERGRQLELADQAVEKGLTARELEALAAAPRVAKEKAATKVDEIDVNTRAAQEKLTTALQTKVQISRKRKGGVLRIHFHSEDELIRLYERLVQSEGDE